MSEKLQNFNIILPYNLPISRWYLYFNYDALSKRFQKNLLDLLEENHLLSKEEVRKQYLNHPKGYYVYAEPKKFKSLEDGIEYVTRYCGRVAISENRIKSYDGEHVDLLLQCP